MTTPLAGARTLIWLPSAGAEQGDCLLRAGHTSSCSFWFRRPPGVRTPRRRPCRPFRRALVGTLGGGKPGHRLVARRARRARVGAFDGRPGQGAARLDHLARLHQHGDDASGGSCTHRGLRLRAKRSRVRATQSYRQSAWRRPFQRSETVCVLAGQLEGFCIRRDVRLWRAPRGRRLCRMRPPGARAGRRNV